MFILEKIHKAFGHIEYAEVPHTYFDKKQNINLKSVTSRLKDYTEPFNKAKWLPIKAKELGVTEQWLEDEWEKNRQFSADRGTEFHFLMEMLSYNKIFPRTLVSDKLFTMGQKYINDHKHLVTVVNELIVGNDILAGQVDRLVYDPTDMGFHIKDYKTDKEIKFDSPFGNMKGCLKHLPSTNFSKYCCQLNIYRFLFEVAVGVKISSMEVIWCHEENDSYELIPIPKMDNTLIKKIIYGLDS